MWKEPERDERFQLFEVDGSKTGQLVGRGEVEMKRERAGEDRERWGR